MTINKGILLTLAASLLLIACGEEKSTPPAQDETAVASLAPAGPTASSQEARPAEEVANVEQMTNEIGTLYIELKRQENELRAREERIRSLESELSARNADLTAKEENLHALETQLMERAVSLDRLKMLSYAVLAIGAVMLLTGYVIMRVGKRQRARFKAAQVAQNESA